MVVDATTATTAAGIVSSSGGIAIGAGIAMAGGALGTGLAQASIGAAIMGILAERPEDMFKLIIYMALPELIVIFGFVVALMLMGKM